MTNSYKDALDKLQAAQGALDKQDVSQLPKPQLMSLEKSKAAVHGEIQALLVRQMEDRDQVYATLTTGFRDCKSELDSLSSWIAKREARDRAIFAMLTKGVSIALSLLV